MAWAAGVAGTCVSISENSGGFPTAVFFFQSFLCLVAAILSLVLIEGRAYAKVRDTEGNCFDASSCLGGACGSYDCVCWKPDGSEDCDVGTSQRVCLTFLGDKDCDQIGDSEALLLASSVLHIIIIALAALAIFTSFATCCCCKFTVLLRNENGVTRIHRL